MHEFGTWWSACLCLGPVKSDGQEVVISRGCDDLHETYKDMYN